MFDLLKITGITITAILIFCKPSSSQIVFEKAIAGGFGNKVVETSDGGFAIAGSNTASLLLIKTDVAGDMIWEKQFGDISGLHPEHEGTDLMQMNDGGFIICGRGRPFNSNSFAYFIRTDSTGNELWNLKVYSDILPNQDEYYALKMHLTSTGEIVAAGRYDQNNNTSKDYTIIKIDTSGNLISRKHVNTGFNEFLTDFIYTDTAYYFLGSLNANGNSVFNICKTDTAGNIILNKMYGLNQNSIEIGYSILLDGNENLHVTGIANYLSGSNYFLNEYNVVGDTISTHNFPVSPSWQVIYSVDMIRSNDKFYLTGYMSGNNPDEGIIICTDTNGTELFRSTFGGTNHDELYSIIMSSDSDLVCVGQTSSFGPSRKVYLLKVDPLQILFSENQIIEDEFIISWRNNMIFIDFTLENPSIKKIELIDLSGKILAEMSTGNRIAELETALFRSGIYILRIEFDGRVISKKLFLSS